MKEQKRKEIEKTIKARLLEELPKSTLLRIIEKRTGSDKPTALDNYVQKNTGAWLDIHYGNKIDKIIKEETLKSL